MFGMWDNKSESRKTQTKTKEKDHDSQGNNSNDGCNLYFNRYPSSICRNVREMKIMRILIIVNVMGWIAINTLKVFI